MPRIALLMLIAFPATTLAGISAPNSAAIYSRDGSRILIMRSPDPRYDQTPTITLHDARVVNIRDTFPKSGVYDARTLQPLWQVEWFSLEWDLLFSDDFQFVARINRKGMRDTWALAFYDSGNLTRMYTCDELLTCLDSQWLLPYSTWNWHVKWYEDFDPCGCNTGVRLTTARRRLMFLGQRLDLGLYEAYDISLRFGTISSRSVEGGGLLAAYILLLIATPVIATISARAAWRRIQLVRQRRRRGFEILCPSHGMIAPPCPTPRC